MCVAEVRDTGFVQRLGLLAFLLFGCLAVVPATALAQDADTAAANATVAASIPSAPLPPMTPDPTFKPTDRLVRVARLVTKVGVYKQPGAISATKVIAPWIASTGNPVVLTITERVVDPTGAGWLKVLLPSRPNGSTGWIRESNTIVSVDTTRVVISLKRHTLTVFRKGRVIRRVGVALGAPSTPTPRGTFAIYQKVREPAYSPLGPWALHLTAHSNVLFEFAGGPGRVAIHGARGELWAEAGTNPSHGCIRVPDPGIGKIAALVRPGTPVKIVA
jgi:lipoprotein-anchoring transpeptidase ErfK/SrfK